ncbi:hypothetical protein P7L79_11105 [Tistrella mobilis]|uniref:hypothetical protein n=1 Tax=Tistrella mobilis TaxID=171437 RepID=UPI0035590E87
MERPATTETKRREDILVSVCFSDLPRDATTFRTLRALAERLDARFRFREIVVVADVDSHEAYFPLVQSVPNLRLLAVPPGYGYYDKRLVAAEEAIGDVVLLTRSEEIAFFDPVRLIEQAVSENRAVLGTRSATTLARKGLWAPVIVLGRMTGFKVGPRDLQTIALPRTMLNQLLAHPSPELALRFPPRDPRFPLTFSEAAPGVARNRSDGTLLQRLQLTQKLLIHLAPALLSVVTITSALLTLLGLFFIVYVLGAWVLVDNLAPGWLTTSAMLSLTATFLGVSILGISLGMQQIIGRQEKAGLGNIAREVNRIDLFGQVASELNVDHEGVPPSQVTSSDTQHVATQEKRDARQHG